MAKVGGRSQPPIRALTVDAKHRTFLRIVSSAPNRSTSFSLAEYLVDLSILGLNFAYAILGVVLMWASYRVFDHLTPEVDFPVELQKGNVAVAIFIGALFLAIAIVVGQALN